MLQLEPQGPLIAFRVFISFPAAHTFLKFSAVFPVACPVRILFPRDIKIHVYEAISGIFHALPDSFICVEEKGAAITFAGPMPPGQVGQLVGHLAAGLCSTLGTIVNGQPIGDHFRGDDAPLRAGENEVIAGGVDLPFVFFVFIA